MLLMNLKTQLYKQDVLLQTQRTSLNILTFHNVQRKYMINN